MVLHTQKSRPRVVLCIGLKSSEKSMCVYGICIHMIYVYHICIHIVYVHRTISSHCMCILYMYTCCICKQYMYVYILYMYTGPYPLHVNDTSVIQQENALDFLGIRV